VLISPQQPVPARFRDNNNGALTAYSNADASITTHWRILLFRRPDPTVYGRTGRGYLRGLSRWNVDFGVSKTTKITNE